MPNSITICAQILFKNSTTFVNYRADAVLNPTEKDMDDAKQSIERMKSALYKYFVNRKDYAGFALQLGNTVISCDDVLSVQIELAESE